ncbi:MAG: CaiB/BaiF CoA transferase family protein [bacterium]
MSAPRANDCIEDRDLLRGLRVLDLSQFIPGPYATRILADQGAEVIKVEPPRGDPMRTLLHRGDAALSPVYRAINRGKRICALDLKSDDGQRALIELARGADVLLESFRPGVMTRLNLGWPTLREINPAMIYCSLSGYGQRGRYRARAGHDINYCAAAGLLSAPTAGEPARPAFAFPPIADHAAAMLAANAILAALYARAHHRDARGRHLDVSIYESVLAFNYLSNLRAAGCDIGHIDFLSGNAACYNLYQTADRRFVSLGAVETKFWCAFCDAMDQPEWIARQHEAFPQRALIAEVQARFAAQPLAHWNALLLDVECCYEPVPRSHQVLRHPQTRDRELATEHDIRYPAWIDDAPANAPKSMEMIDGATLDWRATKIQSQQTNPPT